MVVVVTIEVPHPDFGDCPHPCDVVGYLCVSYWQVRVFGAVRVGQAGRYHGIGIGIGVIMNLGLQP